MGVAMESSRKFAESELESVLTSLGADQRLAVQRVATLLLDRAARQCLADKISDPCVLVLRPRQAASALDLSLEWVRRSLGYLRHQGLIAWDGTDKVSITRPDALIDLARQRASNGRQEDAAGS